MPRKSSNRPSRPDAVGQARDVEIGSLDEVGADPERLHSVRTPSTDRRCDRTTVVRRGDQTGSSPPSMEICEVSRLTAVG